MGIPASTWPEDILQFAFIPEFDDRLTELAEPEDWSYHNTESEHPYPILFNYVRYTYRRLAEERKIALSEDGQFSCFNTGLVTPKQELLYASFETNRQEGVQPWFFKGWYRRGQWELNKFPELPGLAHYFDDLTCLVFDARNDLRVNIEHIIADTPRERFPEPYNSMDDFALQNVLRGVIDMARESNERFRRKSIL